MPKEILIGVLGVVAGSVATAFLRWPGEIWRRLKAWYLPDHRSLYTGWAVASPPSSGGQTIRVQLLCAPDRSSKPQPIDLDLAMALVETHFPELFPSGPVFAMPDHGVRFEAGPDGFRDGYVWVWANGRIDLDCHVVPRVAENHLFLSVLDLLRPILTLKAVVESREYRCLFSAPRLPRRRFDWHIGIATSIVDTAGVTRFWNDLDFPGRQPRRGTNDQQPFCPSGGYASRELRSMRPGLPTSSILRPFLEDFLKQNGYFAIDGAVVDALAAIEGKRPTTTGQQRGEMG